MELRRIMGRVLGSGSVARGEGTPVHVDTDDIISATDASTHASKYLSEAACGRTFLVAKGNRPYAAIVGYDEMNRLQKLNDAAEDLRLFTMAVVRTVTDSGKRYSLDEVAEEFGVDLDDDGDEA